MERVDSAEGQSREMAGSRKLRNSRLFVGDGEGKFARGGEFAGRTEGTRRWTERRGEVGRELMGKMGKSGRGRGRARSLEGSSERRKSDGAGGGGSRGWLGGR